MRVILLKSCTKRRLYPKIAIMDLHTCTGLCLKVPAKRLHVCSALSQNLAFSLPAEPSLLSMKLHAPAVGGPVACVQYEI